MWLSWKRSEVFFLGCFRYPEHMENPGNMDHTGAMETFEELNYRFLVSHAERMILLLDTTLLRSFGPQSVQHQHIVNTYGPEDPMGAITSQVEACKEAMTQLVGEVNRRYGRPFPLERLLFDAPTAHVAREGFLLALAAVLDPRVRQRIALLRDNILLGFVDVGIVLQLFGGSPVETLKGRRYFEPEGVLQRARLIELAFPKDSLSTDYLLAREIRIPSRVESFVLGRQALDNRVAPYARAEEPFTSLEQVIMSDSALTELLGLLEHLVKPEDGTDSGQEGKEELVRVGRSLVIHLQGGPGTGKTLLVDAVSSRLNRALLTVDCAKLAGAKEDFSEIVDLLFFEARQRGALLCFDGAEQILGEGDPRASSLLRHFESHEGIIVLTSSKNLGVAIERWIAYRMKLPLPDAALREKLWELHMPEHISVAQDVDIPSLAHPYELSGGQIRNGILLAMNRAMSQGGTPCLTQSLLTRSAQDQLRADVGDMGDKSNVSLRLEHLVLPEKEADQIREILDACRVRTYVMTHWGFGKRISTGRGMTLLFSGEPGTGKTLCAEILAAEMELPLFRVSVPRIMSKWVGETEKNIADVFKKAKGSHSMLLFDEADSLFTSRVKVENSVDRFANMETNLLLQEIERFEGVIILTTNHEKNIDEAFQRRIQFKVTFPFPDAEQRGRIWKTLVPPECPVDENMDFGLLGESYELSGGYIKNAILKAAYRAAIEDKVMGMDHIEAAAEQECRNAGKIFQSIGRNNVESLF